MKKSIKKIYSALAISFIAFLILQISMVYATESDYQQKTLSFLSNVVSLDLTKYNVTLLADNISSSVGGTTQEKIRYKLEAEESTIDVNGVFRDGTLAWYTLYVIEGSPLHKQTPPANTINSVKMLLQRYQTNSEVDYQEEISLLDQVSGEESTVVTSGNMKLKISTEGNLVSLLWSYTYGELEKPGLSIEFRDGFIETFNNQWNLLNVGNDAVNISKEKAIEIAKLSTGNFSWKVGLDTDDIIEVKDFMILEDPVQIELSFQVREGLTLYPFWRIELGLDKLYPGGVRSIAVGIWADTGETRYIQELAYGGDLPNVTAVSTPTETPLTALSSESNTSDSQLNNDNTPLNITLIAVNITIIAGIVTIVVSKKQKKKRKT